MRKGSFEEGSKVTVYGHLEDVRNLGGLKFAVIRDAAGRLQAVFNKKTLPAQMIQALDSASRESVVKVEGTVRKDERAPGGFEISPISFEVISKADVPLPIDVAGKTETNLDLRLDWRFLDLRRPAVAAIFRIQSCVGDAVRNYFTEKGFCEIHTSKIVSQATEGGANVFPILYFKRSAYLAQSPQFYKQMMIAAGFERVWEMGPVYRAEPHHTPRHICEYVSIDFEKGYIESYEEVMQTVEELMAYVLKTVAQTCSTQFETLGKKVANPATPFPRVTMREAYALLEERGVKVEYGSDLDPEGERQLGLAVKEKFGSEFVFLTEFPWKVAQFYHMRKKDEPEWTYRADLIYKGLELCTLAQREHRYDVLASQAKEKGLNPKDFQFYLDFFRYGVPPHGGGALGLERIVMQMLDLPNIRESTLLPRTPERLTP
ncbi:MAG: aspartate--tRNA(Asn) ligase [Thermoprotei archaeon]